MRDWCDKYCVILSGWHVYVCQDVERLRLEKLQIDAELRTLSTMPSTVYMSQTHRDSRRWVARCTSIVSWLQQTTWMKPTVPAVFEQLLQIPHQKILNCSMPHICCRLFGLINLFFCSNVASYQWNYIKHTAPSAMEHLQLLDPIYGTVFHRTWKRRAYRTTDSGCY